MFWPVGLSVILLPLSMWVSCIMMVSVISSSPGRLDLLDGVEDLVVGDVYADQSPVQIILTVQLRGGEEC